MAGRTQIKGERPKCKALLRDKSRCRGVAVVDGWCAGHYARRATATAQLERLYEREGR